MSGVRQVRAYGLPEVAVGGDDFNGHSPVLPLLAIVIGLAAATIWFVWLPLVGRAETGRSCEVYVLPSGNKCVPYWQPGSAPQKQTSVRQAED